MEDETELVRAARSDRQAFGVLYDRYCDDIYNYIARRVGDTEVAEDITATTWVRALGAIERYEVRGLPFAAWLYRIAGNLVANYHRQRATRPVVALDPRLAGERDTEERRVDRVAVDQGLAALSESDRELLALCYYAGLAPQEVAEVLGCSQAAVHKRLHRARERLRHQLEATV